MGGAREGGRREAGIADGVEIASAEFVRMCGAMERKGRGTYSAHALTILLTLAGGCIYVSHGPPTDAKERPDEE